MQRKPRALDRALDRARAAVTLDDRVDDREAESEPTPRLSAAVDASEALEDPVERVRRYPDAGVRDLDHNLGARHATSDFDHVMHPRVIDRVLDQSVERDAQGVRVGIEFGAGE